MTPETEPANSDGAGSRTIDAANEGDTGNVIHVAGAPTEASVETDTHQEIGQSGANGRENAPRQAQEGAQDKGDQDQPAAKSRRRRRPNKTNGDAAKAGRDDGDQQIA